VSAVDDTRGELSNMNANTEIRERSVEVNCKGRRVPAVLWIPSSAPAEVPLVLVGRGGGGHKRAPTVLAMARKLRAQPDVRA
jgi:hypothetical protein